MADIARMVAEVKGALTKEDMSLKLNELLDYSGKFGETDHPNSV